MQVLNDKRYLEIMYFMCTIIDILCRDKIYHHLFVINSHNIYVMTDIESIIKSSYVIYVKQSLDTHKRIY